MKVILLEDVKSLGKKGDTVDVSEGYAKNCLLKKKLGVEATATNMNNLKLQKQHEDKLAAEKLAEAKALAEKLAELTVETSIKSGKDGRTFGSVSSKEIAEELKKQHGIDIDKKKIVLDDAIRTLGTTIVTVKLHKDVAAKLNVHVSEA